MSQKYLNFRKIGAWCGIIGPILFTFFVLVFGSFNLGYDHMFNVISELGAVGSPTAVWMNTFALPILGLLTIVFSIGLYFGMKKEYSPKIGALMFIISGFGIIFLGVFSCDQGCFTTSFSGLMHSAISSLSLILFMIGLFFFSLKFRKNVVWKRYYFFTLVVLTITAIFFFIDISNYFEMYGLVQRSMLIVILVWTEVVAIKLLKIK